MKKYALILAVVTLFAGLVYVNFFIKGDNVNRFEREAFISRGSDRFEVTVLNGVASQTYQTVSKVTSEPDKGYYFFWAEINGKRVYVQTPIALTAYRER